MTRLAPTLEDFSDMAEDSGSKPKSPDYLNGYAAGQLDAGNNSTAERQKAISSLEALVSDMNFTIAEARHLIIIQLRPILGQVIDLVLPSLLTETFALHLQEALDGALSDQTDGQARISLHPDTVALLSEDPANDAAFVATFHADRTLDLHQARISLEDKAIFLDLDGLLENLQDALTGLTHSSEAYHHG